MGGASTNDRFVAFVFSSGGWWVVGGTSVNDRFMVSLPLSTYIARRKHARTGLKLTGGGGGGGGLGCTNESMLSQKITSKIASVALWGSVHRFKSARGLSLVFNQVLLICDHLFSQRWCQFELSLNSKGGGGGDKHVQCICNEGIITTPLLQNAALLDTIQ